LRDGAVRGNLTGSKSPGRAKHAGGGGREGAEMFGEEWNQRKASSSTSATAASTVTGQEMAL
jgi:hypothetical protein